MFTKSARKVNCLMKVFFEIGLFCCKSFPTSIL